MPTPDHALLQLLLAAGELIYISKCPEERGATGDTNISVTALDAVVTCKRAVSGLVRAEPRPCRTNPVNGSSSSQATGSWA